MKIHFDSGEKKKLITTVRLETEMSAKEAHDIFEEWLHKGSLDIKELMMLMNSKSTRPFVTDVNYGKYEAVDCADYKGDWL